MVRFFGADAQELLPRADGVWTLPALAARTAAALKAAEIRVPLWFSAFVRELQPKGLEHAVFAMHCYWEGERQLGGLPGVVRTQAAWLEGAEVVEVTFDPATLSFADLLAHAQKVKCLHAVFARTEAQHRVAEAREGVKSTRTDKPVRAAKPADCHYYLRHTPYTHLALSPGQATKINAALGLKTSLEDLLSPAQRAMLTQLKRRLAEAPKAMEGLERPSSIETLATYRTELKTRLVK